MAVARGPEKKEEATALPGGITPRPTQTNGARGPGPMEASAAAAWGFYCRFLLEAGKFYSFDLLRPGLFLFVAETKSVPNRAPPAPSEAQSPARRGPPAPAAAPTVPVGAPADRPLWAPPTPAPAPTALPRRRAAPWWSLGTSRSGMAVTAAWSWRRWGGRPPTLFWRMQPTWPQVSAPIRMGGLGPRAPGPGRQWG